MSRRSLDWARERRNAGVSAEGDFPELIAAALQRGDWYSAYAWSKGWVGAGAVASPDPWLGHAASALVNGQPRGAVRSLDLALKHWVRSDPDRAILRWARGAIVLRRLDDPRTASADLRYAAEHAPAWLAPAARDELAACDAAAERSRKRKPSVPGAPRFSGPPPGMAEPEGPEGRPAAVGTRPVLWEPFVRLLS